MKEATERRETPRFEIFAQASVATSGETHLMSVRNISASGALLEGHPREYADLKPGVEIDLALSAAAPGMDDDEVVNIECRAKVVRIVLTTASSPGGFGISLQAATAEDQRRLEDLLGRLADLPAPVRLANLG